MGNLGFFAVDHGSYQLVKPLSFADLIPVLVDLADHPDQIATDTTDGFAVRVPAHVFTRFLDYLDLVDGEESTPDAGNVESAAPVPKRRGRPRKNPLPEGG